ncbi:universal stress protein [Formosa sediminum]|uniref:Universal stress protein n=1 Tax=Formosa sediminum TaxID=2594004 RepID=A0A516GP41_9FLAO|nr:universal stress protein [Formosa sediminum]QDO93273.1 universal stress protein [Formosa sediminum]
MKNILVPVGNSKNAASHLQYVMDFARAFGARVYVVRVYHLKLNPGTFVKIDQVLEQENLAYIDDLLTHVNCENVEVIVKVFKGKLVNILELICNTITVDLMLIEPKMNIMRTEVFLCKISGEIIKKTSIPTVIVPEGYEFKSILNILIAIKSAIIRKESALFPLLHVQRTFNSVVNLLLVKTPFYTDGDFVVNKVLQTVVSETVFTEQATTFKGVLEYYNDYTPDMLCVFRRKRGFFNKMWEKNVILKKDFYSHIPVLVLKGVK